MKNFAAIYKYELRKLLSGRRIMILLATLTVLVLLTSMGDLVLGSHGNNNVNLNGYQWLRLSRTNDRQISGEIIDDDFLKRMDKSIIENDNDIPTYSTPFWWMGYFTRMGEYDENDEYLGTLKAKSFYSNYDKSMHQEWQNQGIDKRSMDYWEVRLNDIKRPFIFYYTDGWNQIIASAVLLAIGLWIIVATGVVSIFPSEIKNKMYPLIQSTANGRGISYAAKLAAGETLAIAFSLTAFAMNTLLTLIVFGYDGGNAMLQLSIWNCCMSIKMWQGVALIYSAMLIGSIMIAAIAMFITVVFKTDVISMTTIFILIIINTIIQTGERGIFNHIWSYTPVKLVSVEALSNYRLLFLGSIKLNCFEACAFIYALLTALFTLAGYIIYAKGYDYKKVLKRVLSKTVNDL